MALYTSAAYSFVMPHDLMSKSIMDSSVYDSKEIDFKKSNKLSLLDLYKKGFRMRKNLVDHVVVYKSHHQMVLMRKGKEVKKYWIALSSRPVGAKQFEGDKKTPEGTYTLDYVKNNSSYYRAFHISYPNQKDIERARRMGRRPGGMIMVHGQPNAKGAEYHASVQRTDWTNGCIAILNPEMDEFISLVDPGTPITINP